MIMNTARGFFFRFDSVRLFPLPITTGFVVGHAGRTEYGHVRVTVGPGRPEHADLRCPVKIIHQRYRHSNQILDEISLVAASINSLHPRAGDRSSTLQEYNDSWIGPSIREK